MKMRFLTSLRFHVLWKSETMSTIGTYHITQTEQIFATHASIISRIPSLHILCFGTDSPTKPWSRNRTVSVAYSRPS